LYLTLPLLRSTLFPYTTLFRSAVGDIRSLRVPRDEEFAELGQIQHEALVLVGGGDLAPLGNKISPGVPLLEDLLKTEYPLVVTQDRKSTRLNSSHEWISYAVFC